MTVLVHQAIYGDDRGAHGLLTKSSDDRSPFVELTIRTDRPGNLSPNLVWDPYISGFPSGRYYVLAKTFPDPRASRPGMVLTHALILDLEAAAQFADLQTLLQILPATPDRAGTLAAIVLTEEGTSQSDASAVLSVDLPGFDAVVHALLNQDVGARPVIWIGQDGFTEIVRRVWMSLWPAAREELSFRLSFGPQDIEGQRLTLVATPTTLVGRWASFPIIRPTDRHRPTTRAEAFLIGLPEGAPLRELASELQASLVRIADLNVLERCQDYLCRTPNGATADEARSVARALARLSPDPDRGVAVKQTILDGLVALTASGTPSDIKALRNFDVSPFNQGEATVRSAIAAWITSTFGSLSADLARETAELLVLAYTSPTSPWTNAVRQAVTMALAEWSVATATTMWRLWQARTDLVTLLEAVVPAQGQIERFLVEACPATLPELLGEVLRAFAVRRSWFALHAVISSASAEPQVAIRWQLAIDREASRFDGLRTLALRIPVEALLQGALETGDERLLQFAGEACARVPALLGAIDVADERWRRVWSYAVRGGAAPLAGIEQPTRAVHELLDLVLHGDQIDPFLLRALSSTAAGDLTTYPRRREVWGRLAAPAVAFLATTAQGWIERFAADPTFDPTLEAPLEEAILAKVVMPAYLRPAAARPASFVISLFHRFPRLSEEHFKEWLISIIRDGAPIPLIDATCIGRLIAARRWRDAAQHLVHYVINEQRDDVLPALSECQQLIRAFDRFYLRFSGQLRDAKVEPDDWWSGLLDVTAEVYPYGPMDQQIWTRAGGDAAAIELGHSGRTSWDVALRKVRYGGGGRITLAGLLHNMRQDFSKNWRLKELEDSQRLAG